MTPQLPSAKSAPVHLRPVAPDHGERDVVPSITSGQLPSPLTSLIGRDVDIAAVKALVVERGLRLLTLTGPGGVGKTRLALAVGESVGSAFADGVVFVPLAAITDASLVLPTIAHELGLREIGLESAAGLVASHLRHRRLLLVLDNFEQVRPAATQLTAMLAACPGVVALVTSRALLHVAGEQRFPVAPLSLPAPTAGSRDGCVELPLAAIATAPAEQLFVARAQAVDPGFSLHQSNAAAVAAICQRLDGLPLAIELAAARVRLLSAGELLAHLTPALPLLTDGPDDAPGRLRTMRQAIAWSYDVLLPEERALFRRLAIFVGGFTLEAAEAPLDLVASLVDTSLLRRTDAGGESRFEMLETIREFGLEQLTASGEMGDVAARHAAWCVRLAEETRRSGLVSYRGGLARLDLEHPNLRAALAWLQAHGETTAALHFAGNLAEFWLRHGHQAEGQVWLERALAADDGEPTAARAEALVGLNMLLWPGDEFTRAAQILAEAEAVARAANDAGALAYARLHQGYVAAFQGDADLAAARGEEALTTCEVILQQFSCHGALWLLASAALVQGDDDRAKDYYQRLHAAARTGGDDVSLHGLAILAERRGELSTAVAGFAEAATVCRGFGDRIHASLCLDGLAEALAALNQTEPAVRMFAVADALRLTLGAPESALSFDRHRHEQAVIAVRAVLGEERFVTIWESGAALSLDEAITEATSLARIEGTPDAMAFGLGADALTPREQEILRLLVVGCSDKEIAAKLFISRRTVSNHVAAIRAMLDAPSRSAAAAIAVRDHLV